MKLLKGLLEQVSYTPAAMTSFYFLMTLLEGRSIDDGINEVKSKFWPTYKVSALNDNWRSFIWLKTHKRQKKNSAKSHLNNKSILRRRCVYGLLYQHSILQLYPKKIASFSSVFVVYYGLASFPIWNMLWKMKPRFQMPNSNDKS